MRHGAIPGKPETEMQRRAREKRKRIYDLRADGNSWDEIGAAMSLAPKTCLVYCERAIKDEGLPRLSEGQGKNDKRSLEVTRPEAAATVMAAMTMAEVAGDDPKYKDLKDACKKAGIKPSIAAALIKRLQTGNYSIVAAEAKRLVGKDLVETLEKKMHLVTEYLDEFAVSQSPAKDLGIILNILIQNHQLLSNQPTHIIDFNSRQQLNVLLPAMIAEAKRRGVTLEATKADDKSYVVSPQ